MYYYFSADFPSAIKLNGIYIGELQSTVKAIDIQAETFPLIEICPLKVNSITLNFILNDDLLTNPPERLIVTDLKGGYLLKFCEKQRKHGFNVISQKKLPYAVITVFNEDGLKLSIETPNDFFAKTLNINTQSVEIEPFTLCGKKAVAIKFDEKNPLLCVYLIEEKITELFFRSVDTFSIDGEFTTTERLSDMAKHKITCSWTLEQNVLTEKLRSVTSSEKFDINKLHIRLLPYAFIEELASGGNINDYVTGNVKEHAKDICNFLGDFIGVMPPPVFRKIDEVGLIYKKKNNLYFTEYFTFEFIDRKICNIIKSE